jgi:MFS transporter, MHS family, citrate/tricarballylate:H+ symporter
MPATTINDAGADAEAHLPFSHVAAVGVGNALEFYDFLSFSFFAVQIGHAFFPASQTSHGLLYTLATFGVGFITRPLGGLVLGAFGDRAGRKPAMILSFSLMGVAIFGLALTPGYDQIGIAAPILLVIFRLVQGFALGGEVGPSTAFLMEAAPVRRRGLYIGLQMATQDLAVLAAGLVGFALTLMMSPGLLDAWGWRVAFLLGALIVPFGLSMRRNLPETFHPKSRADAPPTRALDHARTVVLGIIILGASTIAYYGIEYINTYAQDTLHLSVKLAFGATIVLGAVMVATDVLGGMLTDRIGRQPVMMAASVLVVLTIAPAFTVLNRFPEPGVIFAVTGLLGVLSALISGPALISVTESLPRHVRSGLLGALYAVAISAFGGTTQFVARALIEISRNPVAPAFYIAGAMAVGIVCMLLLGETSPLRQRQRN